DSGRPHHGPPHWTMDAAVAHVCLGPWLNHERPGLVGDYARVGSPPRASRRHAVNSVGFNLARAVGPALGGFVVGILNPGAAFMLNAISFVGVMIVLYLWPRTPELTGATPESIGSAILAGIRYARFEPALQAVLI